MSRNQKIVLLITSLVLLSCCACGVGAYIMGQRLFDYALGGVSDPAKAKEIAKRIADYTLPAGYEEKGGVDFFLMQMVVILPIQERPDGLIIMLMQFNSDTSREQMEQQMRDSLRQGGVDRDIRDLRVVGTETVTIKGQPVTLTISEGFSVQNNAVIRQVVGAFQGKGGATLIMVMGAVEDWDKTLLDNFYKSIR